MKIVIWSIFATLENYQGQKLLNTQITQNLECLDSILAKYDHGNGSVFFRKAQIAAFLQESHKKQSAKVHIKEGLT